jgi:subtilase family serine protease
VWLVCSSYGDYGADYPIAEVMRYSRSFSLSLSQCLKLLLHALLSHLQLAFTRVSNEWMKLGARGITVVVASGDDGVGCNAKCSAFEFPYPSSPWITLVSSTQVHQDQGTRPPPTSLSTTHPS